MSKIRCSHLSLITNLRLVNLVLLCLLLFGCTKDHPDPSISSSKCLVFVNGVWKDIQLDEKPIYLLGNGMSFEDTILSNISYPAEARENGIEGQCTADYEININGEVENITVTSDPGGEIGQTVVKTLEKITEGKSFSPGILNGNPVRVKKGIKVNFDIQ